MSKGDPGIITYVALGIGAYVLLNKKPANAITPQQKALSVALPRSPNTMTSSYNAWVQESLNKLFPDARLMVDGVIGPQTRQYIIKFQEMWNIAQDGVVGAETDYYLRSAQGMAGYTDNPYSYTAQNTWY